MQYKPDIFYKTEIIDLDTKRKILLAGLKHHTNMWCDVKPEARRIVTDKFQFADFYNDLHENDFFGVKLVRSYEDPYFGSIMVNKRIHQENVYLWIDMELKSFNRHIVNKFKLEELK